MHDVANWDPVKHVILGFMHNWLEGVLQRHLRVLWGIGRPKKKGKGYDNLGNLDPEEDDEQFTDAEMSESASELEYLHHEEIEHEDSHKEDSDDEMEIDDDSEKSNTPTPATYLGIINDELDADEEFFEFEITGAFNFSPMQLGDIRACIRDIELPTWVVRPPKNLGEAKHGELKADEYLVLFTVIFPLVIPEFWWGEGPAEKKFLENFHHLVASTNIISSFSTSNVEADQFTDHYVQYREALPQLFTIPEFHSVPNHHFAMHNGDLLKFWGPLAGVSEFPGERMNGMLGKVKHNRRVDDMPVTMLTQVARRGRLEAKFSDEQLKDSYAGHLAQILQPGLAARNKAIEPLTELEAANNIAKATDLSDDDYQMLLQYQVSKGQLWHSCYQLPHPAGSLVLPPCAMKPLQFKLQDRGFSCYKSHRGNSAIQFKDPVTQSVQTGFIDEIWEIPLENHMQTFILVQKHKLLSSTLLKKTPFPSFPLFKTTVVDAAPSNRFCIIEPRHILTHLTVYH
ncbi:hypothetical protein DFH09DRAFT_992899, partial [Mycena vulgaris]